VTGNPPGFFWQSPKYTQSKRAFYALSAGFFTFTLVSGRHTLLFLTSGFPYGTGETFIENEIPFLAKGFEKVIILTPERYKTKEARPVPENVTVQTNPEAGLWHKRLKTLTDKRFWKAFRSDLKRKNLSCSRFQAFRVAWGVFAKALNIERQVNRWITRPEKTVLYSYWLDEAALGLALAKQRNPEFAAVSRAHGWDVFEERHKPAYLPFRPWISERLDTIYCISENGKEYMINRFGLNASELSVKRLGTFSLHPPELNGGPLKIISCSSLIPLKRVGLIMESLSLCSFPFLWKHVGSGQEEAEYRKKAEEKLPGKHVFTGQKNNREVLALYEKEPFDLFVSLSEYEGLPVSMMEAQSAGIPILATDVGGVKEIVKDGETGWLLPADCTPEQVAQKLEEISRIPTERMRDMRKRCREHWEAHFSAEKNYGEFVEALKGL
jgi:glycosyltransferase involved in cell wall biosynthesis